jgi:hypothetical protein
MVGEIVNCLKLAASEATDSRSSPLDSPVSGVEYPDADVKGWSGTDGKLVWIAGRLAGNCGGCAEIE